MLKHDWQSETAENDLRSAILDGDEEAEDAAYDRLHEIQDTFHKEALADVGVAMDRFMRYSWAPSTCLAFEYQITPCDDLKFRDKPGKAYAYLKL